MASFFEKISKRNPLPVVRVPYSLSDVLAEVIATIAILSNCLILWFYWSSLPHTIHIHFNFRGMPDRMGNKSELLEIQLLAAGIFILLTVVSRFPRWYRYPWKITAENAVKQYGIARALIIWLKVLIMCHMAFATWGIIRVALGKAESLGSFSSPILLALLFMLIVVYFVKTFSAR